MRKKLKTQKAKVKSQESLRQNKSILGQIKTKTKNLKLFFTIGKVVLFLSGLLFLIGNFIALLSVSPVYYLLVNEEKKGAVKYLKNIRRQPAFLSELKKYKNIYGEDIENRVFEEENKQKQMIKNFEQILEKNPQARDVLYSLYLLYNEGGDKIRAQEYWRRAKEVDPNIN